MDKVVSITEEMANYFLRLEYEISGYKVLITSITANRYEDMKYEDRHFERVMEGYKKTNLEYHLATDELIKLYCTEEERAGAQSVTVIVNSEKCTATFKFNQKGSCSCER
jgi:hypothetical protein